MDKRRYQDLCEFPASDFQQFVGKTVKSITDEPNCDEGLIITFTDETTLVFGFSGCEGTVSDRPFKD